MGQRLTGETVILIVKTQTGTDPYRRPIYEESEVEVQNVLVGSPESQDVTAELEMSGKRIAYVLGIPKGDINIWHDTSVIIRGERFRTIGYPVFGTPENMPMWWKGYVKVERYDG